MDVVNAFYSLIFTVSVFLCIHIGDNVIHMETLAKDFSLMVAAELKAEIAAQNKRVQTFLDEIKVSYQTYLRYLNGKRDIPLQAFYLMCDGLNVTPQTIMERAYTRFMQQQRASNVRPLRQTIDPNNHTHEKAASHLEPTPEEH